MNSTKMLTVSIVLPIFNGLNYTKNCLESIHSLTKNIDPDSVNFIVIVVDDASTDGSYEWINEHYPKVVLLRGNGELWWSGGINLGVRHAIDNLRTDFILWWNNDIIPDVDYFVNLVVLLNTISPDTIIGSKIFLSQNNEIVWSMGGIFNPITGYKNMIGTNMQDNDQLQKNIECDWLTGMGTITPASVYNKIGMVDEKTFPQYHGDSDFTYRAKKNGYKLIVSPLLKIYNDTGNSGLIHDDNMSNLFRSLFSIRSSYNFLKEYKFYRKHSKSFRAYIQMLAKYYKYVGGFFKWKLFKIIGRERKKHY